MKEFRVKEIWDDASIASRRFLLVFLGWSEDQAKYWSERDWQDLTDDFANILVHDYVHMHSLSTR